MLAGKTAHLLVEKRGHDPVEHLDHRDVQAPLDKSLRHLDSNEPSSDQDHVLDIAAS